MIAIARVPVRIALLFVALGAMAGSEAIALAVDFPGPEPGAAQAKVEGGRLVLENRVLACTWTLRDGQLKLEGVVDKISKTSLPVRGKECFSFRVLQTPSPQAKLSRASDLKAEGEPVLSEIKADPASRRLADHFSGRQVALRLVCPERKLEIQWEASLRDGSNYVRQHVAVHSLGEPVEIQDLTLLELPASQARIVGSADGSPVVAGDFFLAYEHPLSRSEAAPAQDGAAAELVRCRYPYSLVVAPGAPVAHGSVIGVVPAGQLRRAFLYYLERERCQPYRTFLHFNCGYQIGCRFWQQRRFGKPEDFERFVDQQEKLWLDLIDQFGRELVEKRGVVLDSFVHDHGWDDVSRVWEFHRGYPRGFAPQRAAAEKYHSAVGVWFSPWGGYSGRAKRVEAGQQQGFETNSKGLSLAGPRYNARFRAACLGMVRDYGVNYFKFDGFGVGGGKVGFPGDVEALLRLCGELRGLKSDVFLNPTSGTWASPFWLLWSDAIWRQQSDAGFIGKGSDRQQWLTYRDNATYHGTLEPGPLFPISSLMLHGIMIHPYAFKNPYDPSNPGVSRQPADILAEIRSYFATGTCMQELHIEPSLMSESTWDALAEAARWARNNADVMADTHWIGGDPGQGAVYGWASWSKRKGILSLRNPGDQPAELKLDIAEAFELPAGAARSYSLRSPWKEDAALPAIRVTAGRPHVFSLKPFEVLVLDAVAVQ